MTAAGAGSRVRRTGILACSQALKIIMVDPITPRSSTVGVYNWGSLRHHRGVVTA